MLSPNREHRPTFVMPCGTGCLHAESLPAAGPDWIWCRRPEAAIRLVRSDRECTSLVPGDGLTSAGAADPPGRAV